MILRPFSRVFIGCRARLVAAFLVAAILAIVAVLPAWAQEPSSPISTNDPTQVTGYTDLSTGGHTPSATSARNIAVIVRFAGDAAGDAQTGYNAPHPYGNVGTKWQYLIQEFNGNDPNAYVKMGFRRYLGAVSEGRHDVVTDFPQTQADGTVAYLTLDEPYAYYAANSDYVLLRDVFQKFNQSYPNYDASLCDTGRIESGYVDNVLIIPSLPSGASTDDRATPFYAHKDTLFGSDVQVGQGSVGRAVGVYNIIPVTPDSLIAWAVAAHEYMHSLGAKDLYRMSGSGNPVGVWDIMASSGSLSWPLAVTRERVGWGSVAEHSQAGTYTLHAPGTGKDQAFLFKSPLSDTEYFVAEYRKRGKTTELDSHIGGSGLIVYRVNQAYYDEGNLGGNDYVYVFRPGETGLGDANGGPPSRNLSNAQIASGTEATDLSRTAIGSADFTKGIVDGALYYSDGRNSGIVIEATGQTKDSITFTLTYPDYSTKDLWDTLGGPSGPSAHLAPNASDVQLVADGQNLYALTEADQDFGTIYRAYRYDGANWTDLGSPAKGRLYGGQLAVRNGEAYFLVSEGEAASLKKLIGGTWTEVGRVQSAGVNVNVPVLGFVGEKLHALIDRESANPQLYVFDGSRLVETGPALSVPYIVAPTIFELNGHPAIAYGSYPIDAVSREKSVICELDGNAWVERSSFEGCAHANSVAYKDGSAYVFQYVDSRTDPRIISFKPSGGGQASTALPQFRACSGGAKLLASGNRLYLAVVDGDGTNDPAKAFGASVDDLSSWTQLGGDIMKPAYRLSAAVWSNKIAVGSINETSREADVRTHALSDAGSTNPPGPPAPATHKATFAADGKVVAVVDFKEGDTVLSSVPTVPQKIGYSGVWPTYQLGTTDLTIEAAYTANKYAITFKNWDGEVLVPKRTYAFGSSIPQPSTPVRPAKGNVGYVFAGWSPSFTGTCDQARDVEYVAQYGTQRLSVVVERGFDDIAYGQQNAPTARIKVTNTGTAAIDGVAGGLSGGPSSFVANPLAGRRLESGASVSVEVRPKAGLPVGLYAGELRFWVETNAAVKGSCSFALRVTQRALASENVSGLPAQLDFTGVALSPEPLVAVGITRLSKGVDYEVSYANNVHIGTASVTVRGKGNYTGSITKTFSVVRAPASITRLAGPIALDTMNAITKRGFPDGSCQTVVIATKSGYRDALTACGLAGMYNAPVLLTDGTSLSPQTASDISRLGASNVFIAGGPNALSNRVLNQIRALPTVKSALRFAGATGTETAIEVYRGVQGWSDIAIVATSKSFSDALSIAPYAYAKHTPIFLAEMSTGTLSDKTIEAIRSGGFRQVYIVGGPEAVAPSVELQLGTLFAGRLAGRTRYETSLAIASWCADRGMMTNNIGIATGRSYYDALAGAALCGKNNTVLILTDDDNRTTIDKFVGPRASQIASAYVFGGPNAVSNDSFSAITRALE